MVWDPGAITWKRNFKENKMNEALFVFGLAVLQNASFTLVSRARNSDSITYHAVASVFSNGLWLIMFRTLAFNLDSPAVMAAYVTGTVTGSLLMHYVALRFIEKKKGK